MSILEERGLFWWHGEPIPDKHFAPEASVLGLLKIGDEGVATLELDGDLPGNEGTFGVLSRDRETLKGKLIEGLLSTSAKHVLLIELQRYGGSFSSNNLSHGGYRSTHCLINCLYFPAIDEISLFTSLEKWHSVGHRSSPYHLAGNRNAAHPVNAILNYAYAALESEIRIKAISDGYDPTMGIMHERSDGSSKFIFDLMEPERPKVDRAVLDFVRGHVFDPADFVIRADGVCRLNPEMARMIVATVST
jgi:CRISPR associated protein Cas1/ApeA N-terminal domain 1